MSYPFPTRLAASFVYRSLELSPSNSTSGMPGSCLAGETLCQRVQTSQPTERAAVKKVIGDTMEDML